MKNLIQDSFLYDILVEDEIDQAFNTLPLITPPATLVDNIMAAVAQLSLPQPLKPASILDHMGVLYVSLDPQQLS
jgi:hypothetical protein